MSRNTLAFGVILFCASCQAAAAQTVWEVVNTYHIGGQGGWDYLTIDPQTHLLYVPRTTHTQVIEPQSGKIIADIPGQKNAHGVAIAAAAGRGFISDGGGDGAIVIFDLKTNAVLGSLDALPDADGIIFDPTSRDVLVVSGRGKALLTFKADLDLKTGSIDPPIELRGEPEFLAADKAGRVYVNLMTTNEVAVVDLKSRKVVTHWAVAPGGQPVGMSIDAEKGRLFIGCRGPQNLIVMRTVDGKVLSALPIGPSVDATKVDGSQGFVSTPGALSVISETSPGSYAIVQTVTTGEGSRTMALDPSTHRIYLPSAEYEGGADGGRRTQKPGTFMILVIARRAVK